MGCRSSPTIAVREARGPMYHWLENAEFSTAVDRFLEREEMAISHYIDELEGPFRQNIEP